MTRRLRRLVCLVVTLSCVCRSAVFRSCSLRPFDDTPNTLMGIDGMVLTAGGLFRDPASFTYHNLPLDDNGAPIADGFNTFQFGGFSINPPITTGYKQYDAFRWQKTAAGDCCISHNARLHSDTPDNVTNATRESANCSNVLENLTRLFQRLTVQMLRRITFRLSIGHFSASSSIPANISCR